MPSSFTPEEISEIIEEFFKVVGTRQYIGARYVPLFGRKGEESIQWDNSAPYEPLTIVLYQGDSYTSRQYVPAGVSITNQDFWALTGNYNAQIESYREEVLGFDERITVAEDAVADEVLARQEAVTAEATARQEAIAADRNAWEAAIAVETTARESLTPHTYSDRAGYRGTTFAVFGDSFTDKRVAYSEYGQWPNAIADAFGVTMRNYGVSGSGFIHGNANLQTQIDAANANLTDAQKAEISVVIVYYGYNDLSNNESDSAIMNAYRHFVTLAPTVFPNARIIMIPFNYGAAQLSFAREKRIIGLIRQMRDAIAGTPIELIDNARFWLLGQFGWFKDSVHPNSDGFKQITSFITNAIMGASTKVHRVGDATLEAGNANYKAFHWVQDDGLVTIYARFVPESAVTTPTTTQLLGDNGVPPICAPELVIQAPINGVNATGLFTLGGTLFRAYQYTVQNASTACIFQTTFPASANVAWSAQ